MNGYQDQQKERPALRDHIEPWEFPKRVEHYTKEAYDYLRERDLVCAPRLDVIKHLATVYPTKRGICFVTEDGTTYQERVFNLPQKIYSPFGVKKSGKVFMPVRVHFSYNLLITEGLTDALVAYLDSPYHPALSLMGALPSNETLAKVSNIAKGFKNVYFLPDNDQAGYECLARVLRFVTPKVGWVPGPYKDLASMPSTMRQKFLRELIG